MLHLTQCNNNYMQQLLINSVTPSTDWLWLESGCEDLLWHCSEDGSTNLSTADEGAWARLHVHACMQYVRSIYWLCMHHVH